MDVYMHICVYEHFLVMSADEAQQQQKHRVMMGTPSSQTDLCIYHSQDPLKKLLILDPRASFI